MLLVQEFLKKYSFKQLQEQRGIYASFSKSGHKWSLNYDMLEAKEDDPLAQECRGLILSCEDGQSLREQADERILHDKNGWVINKEGNIQGYLSYDHIVPGATRVLAFPMKRFFNYGQGASANISWDDPSLTILEKLDGTLCIVYWDVFNDRWCVATRSVPEADMLMDNGLYTFRTLFEKALQDTMGGWSFNDYVSKLDKEITYCYELTTPLNRIVVAYPDYRITLIATRRNRYIANGNTGEWDHECSEINISNLLSCGVPCVRTYKRMSVQELVEWVSTLNPIENEGVVVRDSQFNRIKIKNPSYIVYSKARDSLGHSERNCLEILLLGKEDDLIPYLPEEIVQNILKIKLGLQSLIKKYDELYRSAFKEANAILPNNKKTFAILITKNKELWSAPMFQIYDAKCLDMRGFIEHNKKDGSFSDSFLDKLLEIIER